MSACGSFDAGEGTAPRDAATDDAKPEVDGAGPSDAPSTTPPDATADAAAPFCATDAGALCEDFDDVASAALPKTALQDGGAVEEIDATHVSPPRSLRARFPLPPDADCRVAARYNDGLDVSMPDGFRLEYKVRPEAVPGSIAHGAGVELKNTSSSGTCSIYVRTLPNVSMLAIGKSGGATQELMLSRKIVPGKWNHVVVEMKGPAGGRKASVTLDGVSALSDADVLGDCQSFDRVLGVSVGILCVSNTAMGDVDIAFDDVRLTAR